MCDVVHDGEAFDGVALAVDEVVVDLQVDRRRDSQMGAWTGRGWMLGVGSVEGAGRRLMVISRVKGGAQTHTSQSQGQQCWDGTVLGVGQ